jgi:hypothetical protein
MSKILSFIALLLLLEGAPFASLSEASHGKPLKITTTSLPSGQVGAAYQAGLLATGGVQPYTWAVASGAVPPGLALSTTGTLSGTPTLAGSFSFTVRTSDQSGQTASQAYSLSILPATMPSCTLSVSPNPISSGQSAMLSWTTSNATSFSISGIGTVTPTSSGSVSVAPTSTTTYTGTATGSGGTGTCSVILTVNGAPSPLAITTTSLPGGQAGTAYSATLAASGGVPPYSWYIGSGALPPGLSISSGGSISGTPSSAGSYSFTAEVKDSASNTASQALSIAVASSTTACNLVASTAGSDTNSGTLAQPFRTVQKLLNSLSAGQVGCIRGGTYFGQVTANNSGTSGNPITVESYPGETATIDSGTPLFRTVGNSDWVLVDATTGEYKSAQTMPSGHYWAYVDGIAGYSNLRMVLVPYYQSPSFYSTSDTQNSTGFYVGPGTYWDSTDSRLHIKLTKTAAMKYAESRYGTVFPSDPADPRQYSIIASNASYTLTVNASFITFKNLTIDQGYFSVILNGHDITLDHDTVWYGYYTVEGGRANGSNTYNITIENSKIYGDKPYWIFWSDLNTSPNPADELAGDAIFMEGGTHDWNIHHNHIRGWGDDGVTTYTNETNIFIHHNRIEGGADDCTEAEGWIAVNHVEIFDNYIANCLSTLETGNYPKTTTYNGPVYFYRNMVSFLEEQPISRQAGLESWNGGTQYCCQEYVFRQTGSGYNGKNIHIYQNTIVTIGTSSRGINITPAVPTAGLTSANNLLMMVNGYKADVNELYNLTSGTIVDGNLYWKMNTADGTDLAYTDDTIPALAATLGVEAHGQGSVQKQGTNPLLSGFTLQFVNTTQSFWHLLPSSEIHQPTDFFLSASTPPIGSGIDLGSYGLPDSSPYSSKPDLGAYPLGTSTADYDIFPYYCTGPTCN